MLSCPLGSSVHGIFQARILEWVAISLSQGIFLTQGSNPILVHCLHCRQILYHRSTWEASGSYEWDLKCHIYFSPKQKGTGLHNKACTSPVSALCDAEARAEGWQGITRTSECFSGFPLVFPLRAAQLCYSHVDFDHNLSSWHSHAQFERSPQNIKGFQSVLWLVADSGVCCSLVTKY